MTGESIHPTVFHNMSGWNHYTMIIAKYERYLFFNNI